MGRALWTRQQQHPETIRPGCRWRPTLTPLLPVVGEARTISPSATLPGARKGANVEKKRAHLAMIQSIINRMSVGSWLLKGWSVLVASALLAVAANATRARFAWLALFMAIAFWILDAHFLRQERLFRKTYERVRNLDESEVDFSMDTALVDSEAAAWGTVLLSKALGVFHGSVVGLVALTGVIFHFNR
jgi:hypothetical protein